MKIPKMCANVFKGRVAGLCLGTEMFKTTS